MLRALSLLLFPRVYRVLLFLNLRSNAVAREPFQRRGKEFVVIRCKCFPRFLIISEYRFISILTILTEINYPNYPTPRREVLFTTTPSNSTLKKSIHLPPFPQKSNYNILPQKYKMSSTPIPVELSPHPNISVYPQNSRRRKIQTQKT